MNKSGNEKLLPVFYLVPALITLSVILFIYSHLGQLFGNLGWASIISVLTDVNHDADNAKQAEWYFALSTQLAPHDHELWFGYGITAAVMKEEQLAQQRWLLGEVEASALERFAQASDAQSEEDRALLLLRSSLSGPNILSRTDSRKRQRWVQSAALCQLSYATITTLMTGNQQYCDELFKQNNNLLINSSFNYDDVLGWSGNFFFPTLEDGELRIAQTVGKPAPSLRLSGYQTDQRYGIYQQVTLQPGSTVRFSGYVKVEGDLPLQTRVLYIEWTEEGRIHGNQEAVLHQTIDWTYFERTFQVPLNAEPTIQFYPVLLEGQGNLYIDEVRVQEL